MDKVFVPISTKEEYALFRALCKKYDGQVTTQGGVLITATSENLFQIVKLLFENTTLFSEHRTATLLVDTLKAGVSDLTVKVGMMVEQAAEPPKPKARTKKAWQPDTQEAGKKECRACYQLKWVNEDGLCKWCVKRAERNRQVLLKGNMVDLFKKETTEVVTTSDVASDVAGDAGPAEQPKCSNCGRTGMKLGKKSGMCADCNIKAVAEGTSKSLQASERRAGGGMQVLAQGMRRGSGQALKARRLG